MSVEDVAKDGSRGFTPRELAWFLRVSPDRVRAWIRSGELPAINVANHACGRPKFIILPSHLETFEQKRRVGTPVKRTAVRKRHYRKDWFPD